MSVCFVGVCVGFLFVASVYTFFFACACFLLFSCLCVFVLFVVVGLCCFLCLRSGLNCLVRVCFFQADC